MIQTAVQADLAVQEQNNAELKRSEKTPLFVCKFEFVELFLVRVVAGFHACTRSLREVRVSGGHLCEADYRSFTKKISLVGAGLCACP